MFLAQVFHFMTQILKWNESTIYSIYKIIVNDDYEHHGLVVFASC